MALIGYQWHQPAMCGTIVIVVYLWQESYCWFAVARLYRGSIGEDNLSDFRFVPIPYRIFGAFWVYIIPKWLIKVPGPFAIVFR